MKNSRLKKYAKTLIVVPKVGRGCGEGTGGQRTIIFGGSSGKRANRDSYMSIGDWGSRGGWLMERGRSGKILPDEKTRRGGPLQLFFEPSKEERGKVVRRPPSGIRKGGTGSPIPTSVAAQNQD